MSIQKVGAVLRKAGFARSAYLASGQIRGWGNSTEGFRVRKDWSGRAICTVDYISGHWRTFDAKIESDMLGKYAATLSAAGLSVEMAQAIPRLLVLAQGIDARSGETRSEAKGLDPKDESPVPEGHAP